MLTPYRFHELDSDIFEDLVGKICHEVLGFGTATFSKGKDGGKDAKFKGKPNNFPSKSESLEGSYFIQAKHTSNPVASYSDSEFKAVLKKELPRIKKLVEEEGCEYYILLSNRKLTGVEEPKLVEKIKKATGVKDVWVKGSGNIRQLLDLYPNVAKSMDINFQSSPFRINADDIAAVVEFFYESRKELEGAFDSSHDFDHPGMPKKNKVNKLSKDYYDYIASDSMPYFAEIKAFLENPRNEEFKDKYHATSDELKAKIIANRDDFDKFDNVLTHIYDLITDENNNIADRRLVNVFLHYMYCNCDIGKKDA